MVNEWDSKIRARFDELLKIPGGFPTEKSTFDDLMLVHSFFTEGLEWASNAKQLIKLACGENSVHFRDFEIYYSRFENSMGSNFYRCVGVFRAAKADYENGFMADQKTLIANNLLGSTIEQAEILFNAKYYQAAAIVAGVALETKLKQMCDDNGLSFDGQKINSYNSSLYKAEKYSKPMNQEIVSWASIRNDAAHGQWGTFSASQVEDMIKGITRFLATY